MSSVSEKSRSSERVLEKKPINRWAIFLAIAAVLGIGAVVLNRLHQQTISAVAPPLTANKLQANTITSLGRLEPQGEVIQLSPPSSSFQNARVEQILVKEGQRVNQGQPIAILDNHSRLSAALEQTKGQLQLAYANVAKVQAGAQTGEIEAQKAAIARYEAQLKGEKVAQQATISRILAELQGQKDVLRATVARVDAERRNAQVEVGRYDTLFKEGAISGQDRDRRRLSAETSTQQLNESQASRIQATSTLEQQLAEAKANRDKTLMTIQKQIDEAKATLSKIMEVRPTDVRVVQAQVISSAAAVKQAQADLDLSYVRAPINGEIIKIHTKPGETVADPKKGIAQIGRTDRMLTVAEVAEEDIGKVHLGQRATITSENHAFNGQLHGTVINIGRQIGKNDIQGTDPAADVDARVVEVKIALSPEDSQRVSGLTYGKVVVEINI